MIDEVGDARRKCSTTKEIVPLVDDGVITEKSTRGTGRGRIGHAFMLPSGADAPPVWSGMSTARHLKIAISRLGPDGDVPLAARIAAEARPSEILVSRVIELRTGDSHTYADRSTPLGPRRKFPAGGSFSRSIRHRRKAGLAAATAHGPVAYGSTARRAF